MVGPRVARAPSSQSPSQSSVRCRLRTFLMPLEAVFSASFPAAGVVLVCLLAFSLVILAFVFVLFHVGFYSACVLLYCRLMLGVSSVFLLHFCPPNLLSLRLFPPAPVPFYFYPLSPLRPNSSNSDDESKRHRPGSCPLIYDSKLGLARAMFRVLQIHSKPHTNNLRRPLVARFPAPAPPFGPAWRRSSV